MSSSEEEMWLTQNKFSQESFLDTDSLDIDIPEPCASTSSTGVSQKRSDNLAETPSTLNSRKITLVSNDDLEGRKKNRIPENTKINTAWAVRTWQDWAEIRNMEVKKPQIKH